MSISSQKTSSGEVSPFILSYHDSMSDSSITLPFFRFASKRVVAGGGGGDGGGGTSERGGDG